MPISILILKASTENLNLGLVSIEYNPLEGIRVYKKNFCVGNIFLRFLKCVYRPQ